MIRLTLYLKGRDPEEGDLVLDAHQVLHVLEDRKQGRDVAHLMTYHGNHYTVLDPDRDVASRIALARGDYIC